MRSGSGLRETDIISLRQAGRPRKGHFSRSAAAILGPGAGRARAGGAMGRGNMLYRALRNADVGRLTPMKAAPFFPIAILALVLGRAAAVDSVVVFNEVSYHPPGDPRAGEWVELHNQMAIDIDLSGWHLEDGINYTFAEGTIIPGGGHLVIAGDPAALQAATGLVRALGPFSGSLGNSGEQVELRDRNERLMDRLVYKVGGEWPLAPDGSGATLAKRDPNTASGPGENWASSVAVGGSPGARNFPQSGSLVRPLVSLGSSWRQESSGADLGSAWKEPDYDDSAWAGETGASLISYWPFDGDAKAIRGSEGSLVGAVVPAVDRLGAAGGALAFSGIGKFVSVPGGGGLNGAAYGTISLWAKWNAVSQDADCCGGYGAILARQENGFFSNNILSLSTSNPATAKLVWRQSGTEALITGTTAVGTGWRHIAVTFAPSGSVLYLNGVAQGSGAGAPLSDGVGAALSIGAWAGDGAGFMNGSLDDVAVWDQVLRAGQIAELAAGTKTPLAFGVAQSAVYFSGDGRLESNDSLRQTELPTGPTTYYFRKRFDYADNPAQANLKLDLAVDDGAVVYLNGREVYRQHLPGGAISYGTAATQVVGAAPLQLGIALDGGSLVVGSNVLAVEVHQAEAPDPGMVFGAALTAVIRPLGAEAATPDDLVINELSAAGAGPLQVELVNRGAAALEVAGYELRRTGEGPEARFVLSGGPLLPGGFLALDEAKLGFGAAAGDRIFLVRPSGTAVADALEVKAQAQARRPDGAGEFLRPDGGTFGAPNRFVLSEGVGINEIMFNAPPILEVAAAGGAPAVPYQRDPEQWIELHNRNGREVSLAGWRLAGGIDFAFPPGSAIPAGGYLVVAKDPLTLQAKFPGLLPLGPFSGKLSGSGEELVLRDAQDNPADRVHYYDDGRWPEAADGGGSSAELRDPRADHGVGENWAPSDESSRSAWQTYSYEGVAAASPVGPDAQWREFVLGLMDKGEVLLDDIAVTESPAGATPVAMLQNGTFAVDASKWRIIGNHQGTVVDDPDQPGNKVLRLVSSGSSDHMSNHAETTFASSRSAVNGKTYRISYRAKWISGCRQLNTRLYFNRLAKTTVLQGRSRYGTPGSPNTALAANLGPTFADLRHEPAVPSAQAPVTVSVTAMDPDQVGEVTLWSRLDGAAWTSQPMSGGAGSRYRAVLPGQAAGKIVQFYVEAADGRNARASFPAAGANSRALYKVNDGQAKANGLHNVRLILLAADANVMHATVNLMSNQRQGATVIYDEREVFYDVGLRLKGSEHSRTETLRLGFNIGFPSEHLFRGVHRSVAIDRSESVGYGQREILMHQVVNHCGGVPTKYHDLIQVIAPQAAHTGGAELQLARYTDVFLDDQFENGSEGMVYEYELVYQLNATNTGTPEGLKLPAPDSVVGIPITNMGNDKEGYRWTFLLKNNEDRDDYSRVIPWAKWMASSGTTFTSQINNFLDVSQWLRGTAINVLSGAGDSYGGDGSQHNVQFYVRPSDGKMLFFPHDLDAFLDSSRGIIPNGEISKIIAVPTYARLYYGHLQEIMETTYNSTYMTRWANHFGALLPAQPFASHLAFITARKSTVTSAINAAVPPATPFAITTNGGNDLSTLNNSATLSGTANLSVRAIRVNGVDYPITWAAITGKPTGWSVTVPLASGANALKIQGVDRSGALLATALDTITVTNNGAAALLPVQINEWMANNSGPSGYADPADGLFQDWVELYNPNPSAVDLAGYRLTDDLAAPAKWVFPAGSSIAPLGYLLVWADNEVGQNTPGNGWHAAFQLSTSGESLGLYNAAGVAQHTLTFGPQAANVSEGLYPDGDAKSVQFMANWTPRYPNSREAPMKIGEVALADGKFGLSWSTQAGRSYRVEVSADPAGPWQPLGPDVAGDGAVARALDPAAQAGQRFYRVRRLE